MNELALFAGAGGGILGGHLLGWRTVCAVEWDAYAASVLAARQNDGTLPPFPIWDDVQTFDGRPSAGSVDVVSGGFPCQDVSKAGAGQGIEGARSGLWFEYARLIGELRPQVVFVENVAELCGRGLGDVLGSLAEIGYDAWWDCIPASALGGLHKRERLWLTAYPNAVGERCKRIRLPPARASEWDQFEGLVQACLRVSVPAGRRGGVSDGLPDRAHRLKALGNAVVPQIPELLGRAWMEATNG